MYCSPSKLDPNSPAMEKLKKSKVFNPSRSSVLLVLQETQHTCKHGKKMLNYYRQSQNTWELEEKFMAFKDFFFFFFVKCFNLSFLFIRVHIKIKELNKFHVFWDSLQKGQSLIINILTNKVLVYIINAVHLYFPFQLIKMTKKLKIWFKL